MSREQTLGFNVISYLRDKLPRYDIDLSYMFDMSQNCDSQVSYDVIQTMRNVSRKHPMKSHHDFE